jgi:hypothetical protein
MCVRVFVDFAIFWLRQMHITALSLDPPPRRLKAEFSGMDVDMETSNEIEGRKGLYLGIFFGALFVSLKVMVE